MLQIPSRNWSPNLVPGASFHALADYIELCVAFDQPRVSQSDVQETLLDFQVAPTDDRAAEMTQSAFAQLRRRQAWAGSLCPFAVDGLHVSRTKEWATTPAYALCLAHTAAYYYPDWAASFREYGKGAQLFEEAVSISLEACGWEPEVVGWSADNPVRLPAIVERVASRVGDPIGRVEAWTAATAKDAGLDVLAVRHFADRRNARPVMLVQCATGQNWDEKLHTPDLRIWTKIVDWSGDPVKAFATPFALSDIAIKRVGNRVNGPVLDRFRVLRPHGFVTDHSRIGATVKAWLEGRVKTLPTQ